MLTEGVNVTHCFAVVFSPFSFIACYFGLLVERERDQKRVLALSSKGHLKIIELIKDTNVKNSKLLTSTLTTFFCYRNY